MSKAGEVRLLSNYGNALLLVANNDRIRIRDLAESLEVSERAAQTIVADLVKCGYLRRRHEGRGYVYEVAVDQGVKLPLTSDADVRSFLEALGGGSGVPSKVHFDETFGKSGIPTAIIDFDGAIQRVNPALGVLFSLDEESFVGRSWWEFTHPDDVGLWEDVVRRVLVGEEVSVDQQRFVRPDGEIVWSSMFLAAARGDGLHPAYFVVHLPEVSDRKRIEEQLDFYDFYDSLTGLANRTLLRNRLALGLGESHRGGSGLGVVAVQLEHFKLLYSTLGHERADELIRQVAVRLATTIRPEDFAARVGDDVFVVVCEDATGNDTAKLAEEILDCLRAPFDVAVKQKLTSVSVGVVTANAESHVDQLLRDADTAANRARELGGNRLEFFDETLCEAAQRRAVLMMGLLHALEEGQLSLHYQPIIDLSTGLINSVEALLRWDHPDLGTIGPSEFVPLIEELGMIGEIGGWVVEQACQQLATWSAQGHGFSVAINISVRQMMSTDLVELVARVLRVTCLDPERVVLELTESVLMQDHENFTRIANELKALGVRLSIDDFGTGYSSLGRLKEMPADELKVDRSFVSGIGVNQEDTSLVEAMIAMARALRLSVTAEGIENATQLTRLRLLGCEHGQGYYLARPMPAHAVGELVARSPRWPLA